MSATGLQPDLRKRRRAFENVSFGDCAVAQASIA
jgi:hypothetical protein